MSFCFIHALQICSILLDSKAAETFIETDWSVQGSEIRCSTIFKWFASDFGKTDAERVYWVLQYTDGQLKSDLRRLLDSGKFSFKYTPYDWTSLGWNQRQGIDASEAEDMGSMSQ